MENVTKRLNTPSQFRIGPALSLANFLSLYLAYAHLASVIAQLDRALPLRRQGPEVQIL